MSAPPAAAPVLLPPNPVWRSYAGGRELRRFRLLPDTGDDHFPEDWLASTVRALNGSHAKDPQEGLSRTAGAGGGRRLVDLLNEAPDYWLGATRANQRPESSPGVLWKLLDASVRLQFQAHPGAEFARRHLGSNAGKTECWYILGTRGEAHVYLGFQRPPSREVWAHMIQEQSVDEMTGCFEKIPVQAGDCYVVPAGTPHAIGAGVFMMELMEPTDWVVRCETTNAGVTLPPAACFMGLDLETCLDIFDYRAHPVAEVRKAYQQPPRRVAQTASFVEEELIGSAWHGFFRLHRLRGKGNASWPGGELQLMIVLNGGGDLSADGEVGPVQAGQTWLLPGAARRWEWRNAGCDWEILLAKPPLAAAGQGGAR